MDLKTQESSNANPLQNSWIEEIFKRFHGRFGNRFLANYVTGQTDSNGQDKGVENAKTTWGVELAGYTPTEIKKGLEHVYPFMPDCDAFKLICRPSTDYESAYHEAVTQMRLRASGGDQWSCAAIYWAYVGIGNDLGCFPYSSLKARWKSALDKSRESIALGKLPNEVPERKVELPSPGQTTTSREDGKRRIAEIVGQMKNVTVTEGEI